MCVTIVRYCNISMSFPARKSLDILKATYSIALLHISNKNAVYLFEISRYSKYFETRTKHLLCGIKGYV